MSDLTFPPKGFIPTASAITGIDVYMPAPPDETNHQEVIDFTCPQCGATTAYSIPEGGITCSHCGYYEEPRKPVVGKGALEFEFSEENVERASQGWGEARSELVCEICGAQTSVPLGELTHTCPFCGSNKVIQRQALQDVLRPRFLVPFQVDNAECKDKVRVWLGNHWMTPKLLKQVVESARFSAVFLPFWTFDAITDASWKAEVGHEEVERYFDNGEWKERHVTRWRWESGRTSLSVDDLLVPGTVHLSHVHIDWTKAYDLRALVPYEPTYLAGLKAQAYDLQLENAWKIARQEMRERTRLSCVEQASTPKVRNFSMSLDFSEESWRYVLLPIYLAAYPYEGKTYQVIVNAQTGEVHGQRPVDWKNVWLVIAALMSPGIILSLLGLITVPLGGVGIGFGGIGFVLLLIGVIISAILIYRAQAMDDI